MAVRTSFSLESASVRNCSLFFASACADNSEKAPARRSRSCSARRAASLSDMRSRSSSETATARAVSAAWAASDAGLQLRRQRLGAACASVSRPSASRAAPAVRATRAMCQANADGEAGDEADDHSQDHEANVTTGCVNDWDRLLPLLGCRHRPPSGGRQPRTEPVAWPGCRSSSVGARRRSRRTSSPRIFHICRSGRSSPSNRSGRGRCPSPTRSTACSRRPSRWSARASPAPRTRCWPATGTQPRSWSSATRSSTN